MSAEPLCARVRRQAAKVAEGADLVSIREDAVAGYTAMLLSTYSLVTEIDSAHHFLAAEDAERTAAYMLALDSINFGSGYFKLARARGIDLEYQVIAEGLKKSFEARRFDHAAAWVQMTAADFHALLGVPKGRDAALDMLMSRFARHLADTGAKIATEYDGKVMNLLEAADHSAARLVDIIGTWPGFHDVALYKGVEIGFFKRGQIFAADIFLAFGGRAPADFNDMAALTCFADNMVPHVLRHDGILDYAPALAARIDAGEELQAGEAAEIEIRACGIHAVELMRAAANAAGHNVTSVNLDHIIWNRGYEAGLYQKPSHQTRSTWY